MLGLNLVLATPSGGGAAMELKQASADEMQMQVVHTETNATNECAGVERKREFFKVLCRSLGECES